MKRKEHNISLAIWGFIGNLHKTKLHDHTSSSTFPSATLSISIQRFALIESDTLPMNSSSKIIFQPYPFFIISFFIFTYQNWTLNFLPKLNNFSLTYKIHHKESWTGKSMSKHSNWKNFQQWNRKETMKIMKKTLARVVVYILKIFINSKS